MGVLFRDNIFDLRLEDDDFNELKNRIYSEYGWPNVKVEITDDQFKRLICNAASYLNTYSPKVVYTYVNMRSGVSDYTISDYDYVHSVQDIYVSVNYLLSLGLPFQNLMGDVMTLAASNDISIMTDWVNLYAAHDFAKRMFGSQPMATCIQPNIIRISPVPSMETTFCFEITVNHDKNLASLTEYEVNWFLRYLKALVGKTIGETRRKYDGVQLPVGSLSNSGGSLYSENLEKEKELIEEIRNRHKLPAAYISIG